jgi:hypothetical protein
MNTTVYPSLIWLLPIRRHAQLERKCAFENSHIVALLNNRLSVQEQEKSETKVAIEQKRVNQILHSMTTLCVLDSNAHKIFRVNNLRLQ